MNAHAAHDRRVIRNAGIRTDFCFSIAYDHAVVEIMIVRIDIGVIGDGAAAMNNDFSAVVQQNMPMDHAIIFHGQIVSKGKFYPMEDFYILADVFKNMPGKHGPYPETQPVVLSEGRAVEHNPEPDKGFADRIG